jgi:hypothetical protein
MAKRDTQAEQLTMDILKGDIAIVSATERYERLQQKLEAAGTNGDERDTKVAIAYRKELEELMKAEMEFFKTAFSKTEFELQNVGRFLRDGTGLLDEFEFQIIVKKR